MGVPNRDFGKNRDMSHRDGRARGSAPVQADKKDQDHKQDRKQKATKTAKLCHCAAKALLGSNCVGLKRKR